MCYNHFIHFNEFPNCPVERPKTSPIQLSKALIAISRKLSEEKDHDSFLQALVEAGRESAKSEACSLLIFDDTVGHLRFVAASWFPEYPEKRDALEHVYVPVGLSAAGKVYASREALIINDAAHHPLVFRSVGKLLHDEVRSMIAVPVIYQNSVLGVLEAINKDGDNPFTDVHLDALTALAGLAGSAVFQAKLVEETQTAYQKLAELDRLKNDFIAIASHELRTPLGLILGHSSLLREMVAVDLVDQVDVIVRSAIRLKQIVEDISSIDNIQSGVARVREQTVSIHQVIDNAIDQFKAEATRKKQVINTEIHPKANVVYGDKDKLQAVFNNLLKNAITFTPPNGQITFVVEKLPGFVKSSVMDTGIGIPPKDLRNVFDRFYQVQSHMTRKHGGIGLGLSVARDMVEMHGGRIWVESVEGQGSKFSFILPVPALPPDPNRPFQQIEE